MNKTPCSICGAYCSGKMRIRARSNKDYPMCTFHFNRYENVPMEEVRKALKESKKLLL